MQYQFWCTRCAFRLINKWKSEYINVKSVKEPEKIVCHEIEPNTSKDRAMHEGDNLSFSDELIRFSSIHIRI